MGNQVIPSLPRALVPEAAVLLGIVLSLDSNRESSSVAECNSPDSQIFFFFLKLPTIQKLSYGELSGKANVTFQKYHKRHFRYSDGER